MTGIDRLFQMLHGFYGTKFVDLWRDQDINEVKAAWRQELRGLTAAELQAGMDGCRTRPWPPTLPEFLLLCRPPLNPQVAWLRAQEGCRERDAGRIGFTDARIFEAYRRMASEVRAGQACFGATLARWTAMLEIVETEIAAGASFTITQPPVALPPPEPMSRQQAEARMAELRTRVDQLRAACAKREQAQQEQEESDKP